MRRRTQSLRSTTRKYRRVGRPAVIAVMVVAGLIVGANQLRHLTETTHREQEARVVSLELLAAVNRAEALAHDLVLQPTAQRAVPRRVLAAERRRMGTLLGDLAPLTRDDPSEMRALSHDVASARLALDDLDRLVAAGASPRELRSVQTRLVAPAIDDVRRSLAVLSAGDHAQAEAAQDANVRTAWLIVIGMIVLVLIGALSDGRLRVVNERDAARSRGHEAEMARVEAERTAAAKNEFLSRMSHELRTPLNAILGFGHLLSGADLAVRDRENAAQIVRAGNHLLDLVDDVLDISRIESGHVHVDGTSVSVQVVLQEALDLTVSMRAERDVAVEADLAEADLHVHADSRLLRQILLNLISNAVKYNRQGGLVTVSARTDGACVRIAVADTGIGIAPEQLPRMFDPFDRIGAEQTSIEGTGLGLAVAKQLTEAMEGVIEAQSELGVGTTVAVTLPRAAASTQAALPALASVAEAMGAEEAVDDRDSSPTVLYIDDNAASVMLVERVLEQRPGVRLLTAFRGGVGLQLARRHRPDLVLLDRNLPDISGDEVLERLRAAEATAGIPVVFLSADAAPASAERVLLAGATDYFTKPVDVRLLLNLIDSVIEVPAR